MWSGNTTLKTMKNVKLVTRVVVVVVYNSEYFQNCQQGGRYFYNYWIKHNMPNCQIDKIKPNTNENLNNDSP